MTLLVLEQILSELNLPAEKPLSELSGGWQRRVGLARALVSNPELHSGDANYGPMVYWLVVAAICAFIAYGRFVLRPF